MSLPTDVAELQARLLIGTGRIAQLLTAMTPDLRKAALKTMSDEDFEGKSIAYITTALLSTKTPAPAAVAEKEPEPEEDDEKEVVVAPAGKRPVKQLLLADPRTAMTAAAVQATTITLEEKQERALARVLQVLKEADKPLAKITPGFASGKHWLPTKGLPTSGSAAYSRFNTKYCAQGYTTLVPIYIDERPVTGSSIWQERKDVAVAIEKFLHRSLAESADYKALYIAREGGSEPAFSATTHFYVYLALAFK